MPTTRLLIPALAFALLAGPAVGLAQDDGTPSSRTQNRSNDTTAEPALGTAVPYLSPEGSEIGTVAAVGVIDPLDDFVESFTVEDDIRYVAVEVTIAGSDDAANAETPLQANASDFDLQTVDGFLYSSTSASREVSSGDVPDLATIVVDPGTDVSGLVIFQVPAEAEIARLFYTPGSGRLILVAALRDVSTGNG